MGMDPVKDSEAYEVTVTIEGRVNWKAFKEFRDKLYEFLEKARNIDVQPAGGGAATDPPSPGRPRPAATRPRGWRAHRRPRPRRGGSRAGKPARQPPRTRARAACHAAKR